MLARAGKNGKELTVHSQKGGVTTLGLVDTPSFTLVSPRVLSLDREDGEVPAIWGQLNTLAKHQGEIVGDPVNGNVDILGVAVGYHFPLLYGSALPDCNGGFGQRFCTGRKRQTEAETQTEEDQARHSHRGTQ